jgi:hypothetical protein
VLRPTKHSHPDKTVVHVATVILSRLQSRRFEQYSSLLGHVKAAVEGGSVLFLPALSLLYLLGVVTYRPKTDAVEYLGPPHASL